MNNYIVFLQPFINTVGLLSDIYGALLVATEVTNQFKGRFLEPTETRIGYSPPPEKTLEFTAWEIKKYRTMKRGLLFLFIGFSLQILATWSPLLIQWLIPK